MAHVPWIRLYTSWPRNKKTIKLRSLLGSAEPILGVWCWASENAPDGDLTAFSHEEIEYQSGWRGEPGKAMKAMIDVGFIDVIDNRTVLHEWDDGSGAGINSLKKTRERQREVMRERRANGDVSPETRLRVFERDGYKCCYCGSSERLEIDHVIPVSKGGSHEESNLKTACRSCNRKKGNRIQKEEEESKSVNDNVPVKLSITEDKPFLPTTPERLKCCLDAAMQKRRPERCPYSPGQWWDREAGTLLRDLGDPEKVAPEILRRIGLFVADDRMAPWTVKRFCAEYNGIGVSRVTGVNRTQEEPKTWKIVER